MNRQQAIKHLQERLERMNMGVILAWSLKDRAAVSRLCIENAITHPATLPQLLALRDALLKWNDKDAAAAADNLIDILSQRADHLYGLGVDFDIKAMGEHARVISDELKTRIDARQEETKRKNKAGDEYARQLSDHALSWTTKG